MIASTLVGDSGSPRQSRSTPDLPPPMLQPLKGFTLLDLTRLLPGGFCTMTLADLGARVIKVEEPGRGDYLRYFAPMGTRDSVLFSALNRGKESLTLNLKTSEGRALLLELAREADVLVEGFRPGVLDRLGLDEATLRAANPQLVICRITGYGAEGARSRRAGHDLNYMATAGALPFFDRRGGGAPAGEPIVPGIQVADLAGGALAAALGIVAALLERERFGRAPAVELAMTQGVLHLLHLQAAELLACGGTATGGRGLLSGGFACYSIYRTADGGAVTVGCVEPHFWARLCERLGAPELAARQFDDEQGDLFAALGAIFAARSRDEWSALLADDDVCVAPVLSLDEALAAHGERVVDSAGTAGEPMRVLGGLLGATAEGAAPALGAHTRAILAALGRSAAEADELGARGIV